MRYWHKFYLMGVFVLSSLQVQAGVLNDANGSPDRRDVGIHFDFLEDPTNQLTFDNLSEEDESLEVEGQVFRWNKSKGDIPNFGYSNATFWGRLTIQRPDDAPAEKWVLENAWPHVDRIELKVLQSNSLEIHSEISGLTTPQAERAIFHRNPIFSFDVPAGQSITIFLKIDSVNALQFPLVLWKRAAFLSNDHNRQFVFGIF